MNELLAEKLSSLKEVGVSSEICNHLSELIETSTPPFLQLLSPFKIADDWKQDRDEVLNAFLYSTKLGIFDLEWDIKCPSCKGPTMGSESLKELAPNSHCPNCKVDFTGGFDDAVEVTFQVNPNIREIGEIPLPELMKSLLKFEEPITLSADPHGQQEIHLTLNPGTYHFFNSSMIISNPLFVQDEPVETERLIEFTYDGKTASKDTEFHGKGPFIIRLLNHSHEEAEFTFAKAIEFPWVSGALVASNQIFRDYFSSELISPDESFAVRNMVFVFTDIRGSTDLYERRGDSKAYYLVKEHFKIMIDTVKKYNGAIVKTIGDAIMASFLVSTKAVQAVFEMHRVFDEFNSREGSDEDIIIKVGIHRGPCIAVTSNDKLDYFGRTVNIAARVQGLSGGGDIMISQSLYDEAGIQDLIASYRWKTKSIQATLKGVEGLYDVIHITDGSE